MSTDATTVNLYILCGLPFSGKTTLAKSLCRIKGWVRVDLDEIKFDLFGDQIKDSDLVQKDWDLVYQLMYKEIQDQLSSGGTVVHDTGNFTKHERALVRDMAKRLGLRSITIWVNTPESVALERLLANRKSGERFDVSDDDFASVVAELEPPDSSEDFLTYDTATSPEDWIARNLNH